MGTPDSWLVGQKEKCVLKKSDVWDWRLKYGTV